MSEKKVYALIRGGLGNQLFIYAAARQLAEANDAEVVLLNDSYNNEFHGREFLLTKFDIKADVKRVDDPGVSYDSREHQLTRKYNRFYHLIGKPTTPYFIERRKRIFALSSTRVDSRFFKLRFDEAVFLDGLFQDETYFRGVSSSLRKELKVAVPVGAETQRLLSQVSESNAVCLHFRRFEMEMREVGLSRDVRGIGYRMGLDLDYYERAIAAITARVREPVFYAFSDYPEWMLENVKLSVPINFVTHNRDPDACFEDMLIMSRCRHHVISHSTFGWWAAWLGHHSEQVVFAPEDVCGHPKAPFYPEDWRTLRVCQKPANA